MFQHGLLSLGIFETTAMILFSLANQYRRERLLLGGLFGFCLIGRAVGRPIGSVGQPIRTDVAAAAYLALLMGVLFGFVAF